VAYIGPVLALMGYAIKQWSSCQQVPGAALDLLQGCRDLVVDLQAAWPFISRADNQERLQRWLDQLAAAPAECGCGCCRHSEEVSRAASNASKGQEALLDGE